MVHTGGNDGRMVRRPRGKEWSRWRSAGSRSLKPGTKRWARSDNPTDEGIDAASAVVCASLPGVEPNDIRDALRASIEKLQGDVAAADRTLRVLRWLTAEESRGDAAPPSLWPTAQALGEGAREQEGPALPHHRTNRQLPRHPRMLEAKNELGVLKHYGGSLPPRRGRTCEPAPALATTRACCDARKAALQWPGIFAP